MNFVKCNFIKKETLTQVFFCEFCEISKNTVFTEHLRMAASIKKTENKPFTFRFHHDKFKYKKLKVLRVAQKISCLLLIWK